MTSPPTPVPFADGSVSFGLYAHDLPPGESVAEIVHQAGLASRAGFDGVTLSEHHGGYPGYVPNPLQVCGWLLEAMDQGWAAAMPLLLSLRPPTLTAEDAAWTAARFPGRVALGFASGYVEDDFVAARSPFEDRHRNFRSNLEEMCRALRSPDDVLVRDPAIVEHGATIPLVVAAKGPRALELSARLGMGIAGTAHWDEPTAEIHQQYRDFDGIGPRVIRRWIWLGGDQPTAADSWVKQSVAPAGDYSWVDPGARRILKHEDPAVLASELADSYAASDATSLSLRVHVPGMSPAATRDQIERVGDELLPRLRERLGAQSA